MKKALLVVSAHDREAMVASLFHAGYEERDIVVVCKEEAVDPPEGEGDCSPPSDVLAQLRELVSRNAVFDAAVVQIYHGRDPFAGGTLREEIVGCDAIRIIERSFDCPILAITDSRIVGDVDAAQKAGAHWFQSTNWATEGIHPMHFLAGQIDHARAEYLRRRAAA